LNSPRPAGRCLTSRWTRASATSPLSTIASALLSAQPRRNFGRRKLNTRRSTACLPKDQPGHPDNYLCEEFYRFLLKEFFLPALRKTFRLSLDGLQKDLDTFVEAYNAMQMKRENQMKNPPLPQANFPVDL